VAACAVDRTSVEVVTIVSVVLVGLVLPDHHAVSSVRHPHRLAT